MSQASRILIALILGLGLGILGADLGGQKLLAIADPLGGIWLDALRMTIIPLVVALVVTGIAATADAARGGGLALKALILFLVLLWISSITAALFTPLFLSLWPVPAEAATALRSALGTEQAAVGDVPPIADFIRSMVPANPIAAAAQDAFLPTILFTALFSVAVTRLPAIQRDRITGFFGAVGEAMMVMVNWVLWLAPIGVFALSYAVGVRTGGAAVGALMHYIVIVSAVGGVVWLMAYPLAMFGGRVPLMRFIRATAPAQAVGLSTQSSLATLPQMLKSAENLGVPSATAGLVLPLAVAIFRVTGPVMNLAVVLYVAHWFGISLGPAQIAAGVAAAAITTMGAVSLPGQLSFLTSIAPIALAIGVPIEPLVLLVAVEMIPDLMRTIGNVTMDVAVTTVVHRLSKDDETA